RQVAVDDVLGAVERLPGPFRRAGRADELPRRLHPGAVADAGWAVSVRLVGLSAHDVRVTRAGNSWLASAGTRTRALLPAATEAASASGTPTTNSTGSMRLSRYSGVDRFGDTPREKLPCEGSPLAGCTKSPRLTLRARTMPS